jgi:hypothetical protein
MSCWNLANREEKFGLAWRKRKKLAELPLLPVLPLNYFMVISFQSWTQRKSNHYAIFAIVWSGFLSYAPAMFHSTAVIIRSCLHKLLFNSCY